MPLIVAIEPDRKQAAHLAALTKGPLRAEWIVAETTARALAALGDRVPDLILTSALLPPKDEDTLAERLRALDEGAAHVQTLTIPVFAAPARRSGKGSGSVLSRLRRPRATPPAAPDGCDPSVFAEQVAEYLKRAAAERKRIELERIAAAAPLEEELQAVAEREAAESVAELEWSTMAPLEPDPEPELESIVAERPAPARVIAFAPLAASVLDGRVVAGLPAMSPPIATDSIAHLDLELEPEPIPLEAIAPEPVAEPTGVRLPALRLAEGKPDSTEIVSPALEPTEPEPIAAAIAPIVAALPSIEIAGPPVLATSMAVAAEPAPPQPEEPTAIAEAPVVRDVRGLDLGAFLAELEAATAGIERLPPDAAAAPVGSDGREADASVDEPVALIDSIAQSTEDPTQPETMPDASDLDASTTELWMALPGEGRRWWPPLEGLAAEALHESPPSLEPRSESARPAWKDMLETLRRDIEHLYPDVALPARASRLTPPANGEAHAPAADPQDGAQSASRRKKRKKTPTPVQDEWGFFDPKRCGFAALVAKLDEIADTEDDAPVKQPA